MSNNTTNNNGTASNSAIPTSLDPANGFKCTTCNKSFHTKAGLQQHTRRRTCEGNIVRDDYPCDTCHRTFASYAGLRQHIRRAHPVDYNADLAPLATNARRLWTIDEQTELARLEANLNSSDANEIINHLTANSNRTRDAIKKRRQLQSYKDEVTRFRTIATNNTMVSEVIQSPGASGTELMNDLKEAILAIEIESEDDETLRRLVLEPSPETPEVLNRWVRSLVTAPGRISGRARTRQDGRAFQSLSTRKRRAKLFRFAQSMFERNTKKLAEMVIEGKLTPCVDALPSGDAIKQHFSQVFSTDSVPITEPIESHLPGVTTVAFPVTVGEISAALKAMRTDTPGPDGITLRALKTIPCGKLALLYNSMLLLGTTPAELKKSRTILIPKGESRANDLSTWRPITISSIIVRLLHRILSKRLEDLALNENQRSFRKIDGCMANTTTLHTIIQYHRSKGRPLCVLSLDVSKAFDTVSHVGIERALRRVRTDNIFIKYISDNLKDATTTFESSTGPVEINVKRGVKQGDPLSPQLFNIVLDELVCSLDDFSGLEVGEERLRCLAYADDILLFANTREDAARMISRTEEHLATLGMALNYNKCKMLDFVTVPSRKKLHCNAEPLQYKGSNIQALGIDEHLKYLGADFSPSGITDCSLKALFIQLQRIKRAPLKPAQKLMVLKFHLLPRYIAYFQRPNITRTTLRTADRKIRVCVRQIIHLSSHCHNSVLYAPVKEGGLGIFCFAERIPAIIEARVERVRRQISVINCLLNMGPRWYERVKTMSSVTGCARVNHEKHAAALNASFSGCGGLRQTRNHPESSNWIHRPPPFWSGDEFVRAIKLRYNDLPCRSMPSTPTNLRQCRASHCRRQETVCHILQNCNITHIDRIERHNFAQNIVAAEARKNGWSVDVEKHVYGSDRVMRKPDLILYKNNTTIVCDVGIHWEGTETLEYFYQVKLAHYSSPPFVEKVLQLYPGSSVYILPFILGARGAWCDSNKHLVRKIGLTKMTSRRIITGVLKGGWMTHARFMRSVWAPICD